MMRSPNLKFKITDYWKDTGFTLIEVVIVLFILGSLVLVSIPAFTTLSENADLDGGIHEFYTALKLAQSKTISSQNDSQYGVYIDTSVFPNKYVIFKGANYAGRDVAQDQLFWLPKKTEFSGISLGGGNEVIFEKLTGYALQSGSVSVRLVANTVILKTVYMSSSGILSLTAPVAQLDIARIKDSRHAHVDYSRTINTDTESITLLFDGTVSKVIPIISSISGGQITWTGTVMVSGLAQTVSIHTHRLNNTDTQFCIHRDGRLNNKTLRVSLSGDATGYVADYSANGLITTFTSFYSSNFIWQ